MRPIYIHLNTEKKRKNPWPMWTEGKWNFQNQLHNDNVFEYVRAKKRKTREQQIISKRLFETIPSRLLLLFTDWRWPFLQFYFTSQQKKAWQELERKYFRQLIERWVYVVGMNRCFQLIIKIKNSTTQSARANKSLLLTAPSKQQLIDIVWLASGFFADVFLKKFRK